MTDKPRFTITLDESTLDAVEKYKYEKNISTRSKAVSQLIHIALNERKSESKQPEMQPDDIIILEGFRASNDTRRMDMLCLALQSLKEGK